MPALADFIPPLGKPRTKDRAVDALIAQLESGGRARRPPVFGECQLEYGDEDPVLSFFTMIPVVFRLDR